MSHNDQQIPWQVSGCTHQGLRVMQDQSLVKTVQMKDQQTMEHVPIVHDKRL